MISGWVQKVTEHRGTKTVLLWLKWGFFRQGIWNLKEINFFYQILPIRDVFSSSGDLTCVYLPELRDTFRIFDRDGDGSITKEELGTVMRNFGLCPSETELQDLLSEIDTNGKDRMLTKTSPRNSTGQSPWVETVKQLKRGRSHGESEGANFGLRFFCPMRVLPMWLATVSTQALCFVHLCSLNVFF